VNGRTAAPPKAFVTGWPVAHSRSPLIHAHWLAELGLEGSYERVAVEPEGFASFMQGLQEEGFRGGNITIPHKEAALRLVDEADETARAIGAVNTVWFEGARLYGSNTDAYGFLASLDESAPGWERRTGLALVLGAGGAARAVLYALAQRGIPEILLVNRTPERAEALARTTRCARPHPWDGMAGVLPAADLLVNTTPLGMPGRDAVPLDLRALKPGALVTDLVYVPLETGLLANARARGHPTVDGLGMLLHQAAPGFERWFGRPPSVTPQLRRLIEAHLPAPGPC